MIVLKQQFTGVYHNANDIQAEMANVDLQNFHHHDGSSAIGMIDCNMKHYEIYQVIAEMIRSAKFVPNSLKGTWSIKL